VTGGSWGLAALLCWHLGVSGGLPREVPLAQVAPYVSGERLVRVLIFDGAASLSLRPTRAVAVERPADGSRLAVVSAGAAVTVTWRSGKAELRAGRFRLTSLPVRLRPLAAGGEAVVSARGGWGRRARYPGALEIALGEEGLRVVAHLPLEDYLAGVVAAEVPAGFPWEAVRAQAIAARTYTLCHLDDHAREGADLCALTHCQAYLGPPSPGSRAEEAVRDTAGLVLAWNGLLVDAMYHAACGGATAAPWEVRQGKLLPYLRRADDSDWSGEGGPFCARGHQVTWQKRITRQQAERLISSNLGKVLGEPGLSPGRLRSLRIAGRAGDRVEWLEVATTRGTYRVRGDAIRWLFGSGRPGPTGLRSTSFTLSVEADRTGLPRAYLFRGTGHGHGIGLCQWGARGRAELGQTAADILAAYYPGAEVVDLRGC